MPLITSINAVHSFLSKHFMFAEDDWINGFVEYATEESGNAIAEDELQKLAREQWLLNDLKDICPGSLPVNLSQHTKTVLTGNYVLQINAAIDIGTPAYQQYLKLQKVNMENVEETTKFEDKVANHRMIKLSLTDGVQDISALEYKPMRNLSCDITPGCKILIKGPVECRRGILLLKESSVELLGGEVQEIIVPNSLAGILSSKLSLPVIRESDPNMSMNPSRNNNVPTPHAQMPPIQSCEDFDPAQNRTSRPVAVVTSMQLASFNDDFDIDQLNTIEEAQFDNNPIKRPPTGQSTKPEKKMKIDTANTHNQLNEYPDDVDLIIEEDEEYLREIEADIIGNVMTEEPKGPIPISSEPYIFIKQIKDSNESARSGKVFRVKAQIMRLLSKLIVKKDCWYLKCTLVDGTGSLDVDFASEVLSKLVGYTPQEMNQLKKDVVSKPELKEKVLTALQKAKETLQVLYCIIEVTMLEVPTITCLTSFDSNHSDLLKSRIQKTGL